MILVSGLAAYIMWKFVRRRRFLSDLPVARIGPEELHERLRAGEELAVVDLRHAVERSADPRSIPGALHIPLEQFEERHHLIPRDREIVLYCT